VDDVTADVFGVVPAFGRVDVSVDVLVDEVSSSPQAAETNARAATRPTVNVRFIVLFLRMLRRTSGSACR
jgi:hypothetical protein